MIEVAVVLDQRSKPLHWHTPPDATAYSVPDSRELWQILWVNRHRLSGVAHSHPTFGEPAPSREDLTTFAAVDAALGRRLQWWIATSDHVWCFTWCGPERYQYEGRPSESQEETSAWLAELRNRSRRSVTPPPTRRRQ